MSYEIVVELAALRKSICGSGTRVKLGEERLQRVADGVRGASVRHGGRECCRGENGARQAQEKVVEVVVEMTLKCSGTLIEPRCLLHVPELGPPQFTRGLGTSTSHHSAQSAKNLPRLHFLPFLRAAQRRQGHLKS